MYKFFLYSMLVILYLGLAKTLSPSELGISYLQNEKGFSKLNDKPHSTFILIDTHVTGFLIKSYYQKYRVISGYEDIEDMIVRSSKEFAQKNISNIGLSIYRKINGEEFFLPLAPGSSYINNPEYGDWVKTAKGMEWRFNKSYKNFPRYLGWGDFRPNEKYYEELLLSIRLNQPFLGLHKEFGPEGPLTQKAFPHFFSDERKQKIELKTLLIDYFKENF